MIKSYSEWLFESRYPAGIETAVKVIILNCLKELSPTGGNNNPEKEYDEWVVSDFGGTIDDEILAVAMKADRDSEFEDWLNGQFHNYGMNLELLDTEETEIHLKDKTDKGAENFYSNREIMIENLEKELKNHLKGKRLGI